MPVKPVRLTKNDCDGKWEVSVGGNQCLSPTLAEYLTGLNPMLAPINWSRWPVKSTVCCIDDGIITDNPDQRLIAISGSGAGEDPRILARIIPKGSKVKPHQHCGKATLVLSEVRAMRDMSNPTVAMIDEYATKSASSLAALLGLDEGRMLTADDQHRTALIRPVEFHPASSGVISLSGKLLHNLLPFEQYQKTPWAFAFAGHYFGDPDSEGLLHDFAAREMLLALQIASGDHGVGIVSRGFRYTALVDANDPNRIGLLAGLENVWHILNTKIYQMLQSGLILNWVGLDVVEYEYDNGRVVFRRVDMTKVM